MSKKETHNDPDLKALVQNYYGQPSPLPEALAERIIMNARMQASPVILFFQKPAIRFAACAILCLAAFGGYMNGTLAAQETITSAEIVADGLYDIAWAMDGSIL